MKHVPHAPLVDFCFHNQLLQRAVTDVPVFRRAARRFVAGETLQEAIAAVLDLNEQGMLATLDHLGENVEDKETAVAAADEYVLALTALRAAGARWQRLRQADANGLDLGDDFCLANVRRVAAQASECGNFIRIDMEGSLYTERTLAIYRQLRRNFKEVGIVIQAYLHRSEADVRALMTKGSAISGSAKAPTMSRQPSPTGSRTRDPSAHRPGAHLHGAGRTSTGGLSRCPLRTTKK